MQQAVASPLHAMLQRNNNGRLPATCSKDATHYPGAYPHRGIPTTVTWEPHVHVVACPGLEGGGGKFVALGGGRIHLLTFGLTLNRTSIMLS